MNDHSFPVKPSNGCDPAASQPIPHRALPTYFISHGGGPWPWLEGDFRRQFDRLEASLAAIAREAGKPRAVLVVSGHWEEARFTVMSGAKPGMVYDYSGFPPHTYQIRYGAPGSPEVAARAKSLLEGAGIPSALDGSRGFDHGTFAPLFAMYPEADVPVLQLSLKSGYDPAERTRLLTRWDTAPAARLAHPQEDHFIPLMVALGAAENEPATRVYHEQGFMGGVTASSYRFGQRNWGLSPVSLN